ncbi:TIGR03086 family metal-binding protein [Actinomadura sp. WMMA1423]|uniref:TIGR03086 family metal-binding protein n=1 Tax=Actinomadura sp. WMMA1423 TaxID=2591108 RepID=UPI001146E829|nr:TIGR03086 family metal-binding protein [Actinomadura sp. WMMA1423]
MLEAAGAYTPPSSNTPLPWSADGLERSICFLLTAVQPVTRAMLTRRTPCAGWDLQMLLLHVGDSLAAVHEGLSAGRVGLRPIAVDPVRDPVSALRVRAVRVLRSARAAAGCPGRAAAIGDLRIPDGLVAGAGALEAAVHGWDVAQATGARRPVPPGLALDLLDVAGTLVPPGGRRPLFEEPVEPAPQASPGERLVAFLGRRPPP